MSAISHHLLVLTVAVSVASCSKSDGTAAEPAASAAQAQQEAAPPAGLPDRDPALAHELVTKQGALLLDVRSPEEFQEGHLEGAVLIPHTEVPARIDEVLTAVGGDKSKPIVVYCRSGGRAGTAKQSLLDAGFVNVTNLGGMSDWCESC